ncbi:hypothetical protein ASF53_16850 [Methylobacterium sp. Leaf123]|uniref:hypothetical protein n=1 Tax=Methylobacterium sp. Leaf123 TaxID=1736264 RepID=UPI0006F85AD7|nr:hypothetical protein [Methylobacterium sp. Leaf123]KQQ11830.1 hypothetical protein ASF53_16850 [Methylobacterium sp. Leaf123]
MREIERAYEPHGIYPQNAGRISLQEVLRRAGLSAAALEKPRHRELKAEVAAWVAAVTARVDRGARTIRRSVTERVDAAHDALAAYRQAAVEAELEYVEGRVEVAKLAARNAELEREVERLKAELAGRNVVRLAKRPQGDA